MTTFFTYFVWLCKLSVILREDTLHVFKTKLL